ncbi:phage tail tape measure protein [Bacillus sp. ISL-37]|uniref:phage tail tape measure protein n=1 Tax=Bacillus sp. ISL-37 TaxID=2819123 RepID=UPI001BE50AF3|nr:phage tail tape measure protein [Bacillus sp. ISL-37]MBT2682662.1 phage tail tape measure protein [Bacillus sp. ISL-37]
MADVGEIKAKLVMDSSDFSKKLDDAKSKMQGTGKSAKKLSSEIGAIQKASLAVGAAIVTGLGAAAAVSIDFEAQMSRVKGIVGASESEFEKLKEAALDLGASTSKSSSEVAIAFEDMAAKGFNATQIIEAMPGVIAAAEASGSDLALTADVVASALNGFGLEASEASRVADILAKTANISAASMDDMAYAFKYVGPVANSLGMDIEQVSAAIGIMTNSGLDGSSAGTALRQALLSLNNPAQEQEKLMKKLGFSMRDNSGNAKSLSEIIGGLTEATKGMTEAEKVATIAKLVGTEASSGMISVMSGGVGKLDSFTKSLRESAGASKEAAAIMKDNVKASFDEFVGSLESLSIELTDDMLPAFREVIQYGTKIVNSLSEVDGASVKSALAFGGTTAAIALLLSTVGKLGLAFRALSASPLGLAVTGISILGGVLAASKVQADSMNTVTLESAEAMTKQADTLKDNIREYDALRDKSQLTTEQLARFADINSEISKTADPTLIAKLKDEQEKLRVKSGLSNDEFQRMLDLNGKIIEVVPESTMKITDQGNAILESTNKAKAFNKEQYEMIRLELEAQKAKAESKMSQYLTTEKRIIGEMKTLKGDMVTLDGEYADQLKKIGDIEADLIAAKKAGDEGEAGRLQYEFAVQTRLLEKMKEKRAEQATAILDKQKELGEIQKQLGKLDEVKRKMVDLELKQAGINAKRGEEIKTIDTSISKLEAAKKKLQDTTPIAQRNTGEYRNSIAAIDSQITKLQGAKDKIGEIIGKAAVMNAELGKAINKNVTVNTRNIETTIANVNRGRYGSPRENYHVGGIVGMPKLHVGGLAAQFAQAPNHNEIDTRLLRDEMVLTQSQQANLFRMIDAGLAQKQSAPAQAANITQNNYINVDGNIDADLYNDIMRRQGTELNTKLRVNGVKK